jgi:hypothetical protein
MTSNGRIVGLIAAVVAVVCSFSGGACSTVECGHGTVERDGKCVSSTDIVGGERCGPGTHEGAGMACVPDEITCDPDTAYISDGGVCTGRVTSSLPEPPKCPTTPADQVCVSGWVRTFDPGSNVPYSKDTLITDESVEFWVYDPFLIIACTVAPCHDPSKAIAGPFYPAADGTYILDQDTTGRPVRATGSYVAILVRNRDGQAHGDSDWSDTAITADGKGGAMVEQLDLVAAPKTQTAAWDAAYPGILAKGMNVFMYHFVDTTQTDLSKNRTFIEDVVPNRGTNPISPEELYFFTTDRNTLEQGAAGGLTKTSTIGGAMIAQESLLPHSGVGGVVPGSTPPETISWESRLGASVPAVVFVTFFRQAQ